MLQYFYLNRLPHPQLVQPVNMATLYDPANYTPFVSEDEICKALSGGKAGLADGALNLAYNNLYLINKNPCSPSNAKGMYCLYLYLYALDSVTFDDDNFLSEEQIMAILPHVEQISKSCCCE